MRYTATRGWAPLLLLLGGCGVLDVHDVDVLSQDALDDPARLPLAYDATIGEFGSAYDNAQGAGSQVLTSGLLADEFYNTSFAPQNDEVDRREILTQNLLLEIVYADLHKARARAEETVARFDLLDPGTPRHAEIHNLAGYTYLFFAENYCAGVPFSRVDQNGALVFGQPETTAQMLDRAEAHFQAALAMAASEDMTRLASVASGRAHLDRGDFAGAAAAVAGVPTEFQYLIFHSELTSRQNNGVWAQVNQADNWSVSPLPDQSGEGVNGLNFRADPRVPTELDPGDGVGADGSTPQFHQFKYPERGSPIPLADGLEARLIEAEAANQAGNFPQTLSTLNDLRLNHAPAGVTLAPLVDPGTPEGRVDLIFAERAFWLWGTGHRLGDLRRLIRQYGRGEDQVFPTGAFPTGGVYGDDVNIPVPSTELNNPNFQGCLDRNA